ESLRRAGQPAPKVAGALRRHAATVQSAARSCGALERKNAARRRVGLCTGNQFERLGLVAGCMQDEGPALVLCQPRQMKVDRLWSGVEDDEQCWMAWRSCCEHVRKEPAFWKTPVRLGHLLRVGSQPQHTERSIRLV